MNVPIKERIGSNESLYESCPKSMCFIVLRRINVPQIRNNLFQLSFKYFCLLIKVPNKAEKNRLIEPKIGALTSKNMPIEKRMEPKFKKKIYSYTLKYLTLPAGFEPAAHCLEGSCSIS